MPDRILHPDRGYARRPLVLIGFGALIAATVTGTAIAKADPIDDDAKLLHALHNAGLNVLPGGEAIVINNAHIICSEAWRGTSVDEIAAEVDRVETSVNLAGAQTFVAISLIDLLPEHWGAVMRNQLRSVICDYADGLCDAEFEQDGFIATNGSVTWVMLESAAREEGWTCKRGKHLCPHHSPEEPFA